VEVEGEKMSKSLGNFTSLPDLLARRDPRAYRLLVLRSHYRSPIEVTAETVEQAERSLQRLDALARRFPQADPFGPDRVAVLGRAGAADPDPDALARFRAAMDDDLDTPLALAGIFELVSEANRSGDAGDVAPAARLAATVATLCAAIGLPLRPGEPDAPDDEAARLVAERDEARGRRDWARADAIRDELTARGWTVEDGAGGTRIRR
jgi:cysteinyl-tRNA synthetase